MSKPIWLRTNEHTEAVMGLEAFYSHLLRVKRDPYYWKWAVIALQNSVQGFMVCALRGTNNLAILTPKSAQQWVKARERGEPLSDEVLDGFLNLYKKIKGNLMIQYVDSQKFIPKGKQGSSIKRLNSLRRDFVHFAPKGLSLEVSGLPEICLDVLVIIDFLVTRSGNIPFHRWNGLKEKCLNLLSKSRSKLNEIARAYGG